MSSPFDPRTAQPHYGVGPPRQPPHLLHRIGGMHLLRKINDGEAERLENGDPDRTEHLRDRIGSHAAIEFDADTRQQRRKDATNGIENEP